MKPLEQLVRPNIQRLEPYSSARNEYSGREAHVFLDANENPYNAPLNRYPDPLQEELKAKMAKVKQVKAEQIFLGNGSDEAIDLCYRCFCEPGKDNVVAIEPTYGMYRVAADINDVEYRPVMLDEQFQTTADDLLAATDNHTKIVWICSPNNPTGNVINDEEVERLISRFEGIVVVDEAYSDFSQHPTFRRRLDAHPNLIVLNTMSKAWGCAAIRLGMAFTSKEIVAIFNKVKYPYNVNLLTQEQAMKALDDPFEVDSWVKIILQERARLISDLPTVAHLRKSVSNRCQLLPRSHDRCPENLRLSRGRGHNREKPHARGSLRQLPPHNGWLEGRKPRVARSTKEI